MAFRNIVSSNVGQRKTEWNNKALFFQIVLFIWFALDMVGIKIGGKWLVTRSFQDDGIFLLIYFFTMIIFVMKRKIGKYVSIVWLSLWLVTQLLAHEFYTVFNWGIMGDSKSKIKYFSETIKLISSTERYYPDLYHLILHLLIVLTLFIIVKDTIQKNN